MDEDKRLLKILKWAGIVALVAVPVAVLLKKRKERQTDPVPDDDSNIFSAELEE